MRATSQINTAALVAQIKREIRRLRKKNEDVPLRTQYDPMTCERREIIGRLSILLLETAGLTENLASN